MKLIYWLLALVAAGLAAAAALQFVSLLQPFTDGGLAAFAKEDWVRIMLFGVAASCLSSLVMYFIRRAHRA